MHSCRSGEPGGSFSRMSGYGLEDRAIEAKGFFLMASVSTPALRPTQPPVQWVPGVLSPGLKRGRSVTLTTHPQLVPRSRMSRSYISSPPSASVACSGTALAFYLFRSNYIILQLTQDLENMGFGRFLFQDVCVCDY
jgi:hypothetical protein